jgi:hypothetical protein
MRGAWFEEPERKDRDAPGQPSLRLLAARRSVPPRPARGIVRGGGSLARKTQCHCLVI